MLEDPQNITDADADSIKELTETYPYFAPARYMQAAQRHKQEPFTPEMMSTMQLFSGNWLLYSEYLQTALNGQNAEFVVTAEQSARTTQPIKEEVANEVEKEAATATDTVINETVTVEEPALEDVSEPVHEEVVADKAEQDVTAGDFNPVNTGFIRGKRAQTPPPPPPPVEEETAEQEAPVAEEQIEPVAEAPIAAAATTTAEKTVDKNDRDEKSENLIPPIYTEDYFLHQGMHVSNDLPEDIGNPDHTLNLQEPDKSLMVVMSFSEWLMFYKKKKQQAQEEEQDQKDLKTMWQKEKLAAALEEENDEIPENVFEMAVNSITKEDNLASESLASVMVKQGRYDRAIEMYKKLSLQKPQKKAYFARKIEDILKEK